MDFPKSMKFPPLTPEGERVQLTSENSGSRKGFYFSGSIFLRLWKTKSHLKPRDMHFPKSMKFPPLPPEGYAFNLLKRIQAAGKVFTFSGSIFSTALESQNPFNSRDMDFSKSMIISVSYMIEKNIELGNSMSLKFLSMIIINNYFPDFYVLCSKYQKSWHFSQKTKSSAKNGSPTIR